MGKSPVLAERARSEGARSTRAVGDSPLRLRAANFGEREEKRTMKLHRIYALVMRYMYLYRRSLPRMMEIFYWPFLGSRHLGIHYGLSHEIPGADPWSRDIFFRRVDSVGYAVSSPAGSDDFVSGGDLGEKSHELVRQSA